MMLSDLPDEVLCCIFDHLDVADMRKAALVCQRWSNLVFLGRRMDRVLLQPKPDECSALLNSKRSYRHIYLKFFTDAKLKFAKGMPEKILHKFGLSITSLQTHSFVNITLLGKFLLEVPNLQELKINMAYPAEDIETFESFPALAKLKYLELRTTKSDMPLFRDALNLPTNSPRLEQLELGNDEGTFFNVLEHFSPQLKVVKIERVSEEFFLLNFPRLKELHLLDLTTTTPQLSLDFFQRHSYIQELKIYDAIPLDLFQIITTYCRNITYLGLFTSNLHQKGDFKRLDQLTKLKHLEISDNAFEDVSVDVFKGCGVISSLEKISFHEICDIHHWSLLTKQVAPQLKCLEFIESFYSLDFPEAKFFDVICKYCSHIDSIILDYCESRDDFKSLERLPLLRDLQLYEMSIEDFSQVHLPTVRFLKFSYCWELTDRRLLEIPKAFPMLERLVIEHCSINEEMVASLHDMIPSCKIDLYGTWD